MSTQIRTVFTLTSLLLFSCIEPFDIEIPKGSNSFLVVDGLITDQTGPYIVKINLVSSLTSQNIPLSGVEVFIEEENGLKEMLIEESDGVYQTNNLQGIVGNKYRLEFINNGQQYQSSWEKINSSPLINEVRFNSELVPTTSPQDSLQGVQFYVDSNGSTNDARYFRYEWIETWKYQLCLPIFFEYLGNDNFKVVEPEDQTRTCWISNTSSEINLATTIGLSDNKLSNHQLGFIELDFEARRFTIRYSLLVKQFSLTEKEYFFWKKLQESSADLGNLFTTQPAKVVGNIININNTNEEILGYFSASGLVEKRIFIGPNQLEESFSEKPVCKPPCLSTVAIWKADEGDRYEEAIVEMLAQGYVFYNVIQPFGSSEIVGVSFTLPECSDCRLKGGVTEKPEFWDE